MAKYDGIIFDLDGTLSDSVPMILKCAELTQKELGVPWDEQKQRDLIGAPLYQSAAILCGEANVDAYMKIFRSYSDIYLEKMIKPFEGIPELIKNLYEQGVKMTVVTSRLKWGANLSCKVLGLTPYLTAIIGVEDTKTHKPEVEPALLALAKMGLPATKVAFVGDAPVDLLCGKSAGTESIAVAWGISDAQILQGCLPTYYCKTVADLAKILC